MFIIFVLLVSGQTTFNISLPVKLGFFYLFQLATEQPLFVALFMRKLKLKCCGCPRSGDYSQFFYIATVWHYISKIVTTGFVAYFYLQSLFDDEVDYWHLYNISYAEFLKYDSLLYSVEVVNWEVFANVALAVLIPTLFLLQMWQGTFFWKLATMINKKKRRKEAELKHNLSNTKTKEMEIEENSVNMNTPSSTNNLEAEGTNNSVEESSCSLTDLPGLLYIESQTLQLSHRKEKAEKAEKAVMDAKQSSHSVRDDNHKGNTPLSPVEEMEEMEELPDMRPMESAYTKHRKKLAATPNVSMDNVIVNTQMMDMVIVYDEEMDDDHDGDDDDDDDEDGFQDVDHSCTQTSIEGISPFDVAQHIQSDGLAGIEEESSQI